MAVTFYLYTRPDKQGDHPIYVSIHLNGVRFCSSIGYSINHEKWDMKLMKVKHGTSNAKKVTFNVINSRIALISSFFDSMEANNARWTKNEIKHKLAEIVGRPSRERGDNWDNETNWTVGTTGTIGTSGTKRTRVSFFEPWDSFIRDGKLNHKWALNTQKKWGTLFKHIQKFNPRISLDDFDKETLDEYVRFDATELQMLDVSITKELSLLRWYLRWCVDHGLTSVETFSKYRARLKDTKKPVIFLTRDELIKLYNYKIPKNGTEVVLHDINGNEYTTVVSEKQSLDKVRDLFCFCAFTSLRYSDLAQLQRTHIIDGKIQITTIKTDDAVVIPVNEYAQSILDKYSAFDYDGLALPVISNQKMNQYLKAICELCEFNEPVNIVRYLDGKRKDVCMPKWKAIGTHAARRTFICSSLAAGISPQTIMKFTGHSDYKAMKPYIEVAEDTKDEAMKQFEKFFN